MALVIKSWYASTTPDAEGNYVSIHGREEGFLSWLLNLIGIDATTRLRVNGFSIYFERGSLAGFEQRVIPIANLSSAYFGFTKPWQEALALTVALVPLFGLGLLVGPLYYFLNKKLALGIVETGGLASGIQFKRSVIEGQNINEDESKRVIGIIQGVMMSRQAPAVPMGRTGT